MYINYDWLEEESEDEENQGGERGKKTNKKQEEIIIDEEGTQLSLYEGSIWCSYEQDWGPLWMLP